jgi:21S rRNA (uridine2791-2'-O)-methyltransferase
VKEFIAYTHYDELSKAARYNSNGDNDLLPKNTLINQPSYIDMERHSTESVNHPSGSISTQSTSKNLVDVRQTALATTCINILLLY